MSEWEGTTTPARFWKMDISSGQVTELYKGGIRGLAPAVSPDGRWLAYYVGSEKVAVLPTSGGEPRDVALNAAGFMGGIAWSSDSRGWRRWAEDAPACHTGRSGQDR
jgi:Tol biopolymer transport system component